MTTRPRLDSVDDMTNAHFTGPLDCRQISGSVWYLLAPLSFVRESGETITAPAGFLTDFASVPEWAWSLGFPPSGEYDAAAVIHDYLYTVHCVGPVAISKDDADEIFYEAMLALGVSRWRAYVMFKAVQWFGASAWNKNSGAGLDREVAP